MVNDKLLYEFISENIISFSVKLNSQNFEYFSNATFFNKVILFTEKKNTPNLYRGLSNYYYDKILFGEIISSLNKTDNNNSDKAVEENKNLLKKFGIKKLPAIIILENSFFIKEEPKVHYYEGMMFPSDISKFVENFTLKEKFYSVRMDDLKSAERKIEFLDKLYFDDFFKENIRRNKIVYFHNDENGYNDIYNIPESMRELVEYSRYCLFFIKLFLYLFKFN